MQTWCNNKKKKYESHEYEKYKKYFTYVYDFKKCFFLEIEITEQNICVHCLKLFLITEM